MQFSFHASLRTFTRFYRKLKKSKAFIIFSQIPKYGEIPFCTEFSFHEIWWIRREYVLWLLESYFWKSSNVCTLLKTFTAALSLTWLQCIATGAEKYVLKSWPLFILWLTSVSLFPQTFVIYSPLLLTLSCIMF